MSYRLGPVRFAEWRSLPLASGWSDTFVLPVSVTDGLPPGDVALVVRRLALRLMQRRPNPSVWVALREAHGAWYARAVADRLYGMRVPYVVTQGGELPGEADFSRPPWAAGAPLRPPEEMVGSPGDRALDGYERRALCSLARLGSAVTAEVAAQAGLSENGARKILTRLRWAGLVLRLEVRSIFHWRVTVRGLSLALRHWHLPVGEHLLAGRERRRSPGRRHRRVARLFPAWLRQAWPQHALWAGWSEVSLPGRSFPDGLCWGEVEGREALFWLEVDSGHTATATVRAKLRYSLERAARYAEGYGVGLIFVVLSRPWVCRAVIPALTNLPGWAAVAVQDWRRVGELPALRWGRVAAAGDLLSSRAW